MRNHQLDFKFINKKRILFQAFVKIKQERKIQLLKSVIRDNIFYIKSSYDVCCKRTTAYK